MRHLIHLVAASAILSTATVALASDGAPYAGAQDDASYTEGFDRVQAGAPFFAASNPAFDDAGYTAVAPAELANTVTVLAEMGPFDAAHDDANYTPPAPPHVMLAKSGATAPAIAANCPCCPHSHNA